MSTGCKIMKFLSSGLQLDVLSQCILWTVLT